MSLKKRIKKAVPDRVIYFYRVCRLYPKYLKSKKHIKSAEIPQVKFYDHKQTVDMIINKNMSLSRFGDGELMWMSGQSHASFQDYSEEFSSDLRKAFINDNPNLLIGIPYGIFDSRKCNLYAKMHWKIIRFDFFKRLVKFVDFNKTYCDASITRPYIDFKDYKYSTETFALLKKIWKNRDVIIVEGEKTKLGMGNDLFSNVKTVKRIICPSENAYERKNSIKQAIIKHAKKGTLLLGALGPTASILASELTDEGYQFIDIGHIDVEYMWYLKRSVLRDTIEGKYVNESGVRTCSDKYENDKEYIDSIIEIIK